MINKNIIVNASALRTSGALTILLQFISEIPDDNNIYYVFVHTTVVLDLHKSNIVIIKVSKTTLLERFIWDFCGLNSWLKNNEVVPDLTISLQNTNFRVDSDCPNFVYYHQSIPFYNYKWNVLKKNERYLWFYKNIYPIFVKLFIKKNTEFFVQLGYIREHFCRKFNTSKEKIHVIFPKIEIPKIESDEIEELNHQKFNLFYPATSQSYKNHELIFNALKRIDNKLKRKIVLYLTNSKSEFDFDYTYNNIEIVFLGKISFSKVIWFYKNVDCLLFPSYMETLGLPLIEAASCGLKIIAADLPYAREVLQGYKGVTFARYDNENIWSNILLTESNVENTQKYEEFLLKDRDSWDKFFKIIKQNSNV